MYLPQQLAAISPHTLPALVGYGGVVAALHLDGIDAGGGVVGFPAELAGIPVVELAVAAGCR